MKQWWWITCKRQLKAPAFLFTLILMIILAGLMRKDGNLEEGIVRIQILCQDPDGGKASEICKGLLAISNPTIRFEACESEEELRIRVARGEAQGGYIFTKGFDKKLEGSEHNRDIVTAVRSDTEANARIVDEIVFGQIYDVLAERIAVNYADAQDGSADEVRTEYIREHYESYKNDELPFRYELPDGTPHPQLEGNNGDLVDTTTRLPIVGLIGILTALASLAAGLPWYRDMERGVFTWLDPSERGIVHLIYVLIPTVVSGVFGMAAIYLLGVNGEWWMELLRMLLYTGALASTAFIIQHLIRSSRIYIACIPVCMLLNLIGGGVFSELDEVPMISVWKACVPLSAYMDFPYGGRAVWGAVSCFIVFALVIIWIVQKGGNKMKRRSVAKRCLTMLLVLVMAVSVSGCGEGDSSSSMRMLQRDIVRLTDTLKSEMSRLRKDAEKRFETEAVLNACEVIDHMIIGMEDVKTYGKDSEQICKTFIEYLRATRNKKLDILAGYEGTDEEKVPDGVWKGIGEIQEYYDTEFFSQIENDVMEISNYIKDDYSINPQDLFENIKEVLKEKNIGRDYDGEADDGMNPDGDDAADYGDADYGDGEYGNDDYDDYD